MSKKKPADTIATIEDFLSPDTIATIEDFLSPDIKTSVDKLLAVSISAERLGDIVSADIKRLEEELQRNSVRVSASIAFHYDSYSLFRLRWCGRRMKIQVKGLVRDLSDSEFTDKTSYTDLSRGALAIRLCCYKHLPRLVDRIRETITGERVSQ